MATTQPATNATTVRFSDQDLAILDRLQALTGLDGRTAVIRFAIGHTLLAMEKPIVFEPRGGKTRRGKDYWRVPVGDDSYLVRGLQQGGPTRAYLVCDESEKRIGEFYLSPVEKVDDTSQGNPIMHLVLFRMREHFARGGS